MKELFSVNSCLFDISNPCLNAPIVKYLCIMMIIHLNLIYDTLFIFNFRYFSISCRRNIFCFNVCKVTCVWYYCYSGHRNKLAYLHNLLFEVDPARSGHKYYDDFYCFPNERTSA